MKAANLWDTVRVWTSDINALLQEAEMKFSIDQRLLKDNEKV
jgi:hypothetical protein